MKVEMCPNPINRTLFITLFGMAADLSTDCAEQDAPITWDGSQWVGEMSVDFPNYPGVDHLDIEVKCNAESEFEITVTSDDGTSIMENTTASDLFCDPFEAEFTFGIDAGGDCGVTGANIIE